MSIRTDLTLYAGDISEFSDTELGQALALATNLSYSGLPDSLMLENTFTPITLSASQLSVNFASKTVIYVTRYDGAGKKRLCIEANPLHWDDYTDSNSIYYATKENPMFCIINDGGVPALQVAPSPNGDGTGDPSTKDKALVYWRPTHYDLSEFLDSNSIDNYPSEALKYLILSAALIVLGYKLRDASLEEEDSELAQLVQMQMQSVKGLVDSERARLNSEEASAGNDQGPEQIANPAKGKPTQR